MRAKKVDEPTINDTEPIDYSALPSTFIHEDILIKDEFKDAYVRYDGLDVPFERIYPDIDVSTLEDESFIIDGSIFRLNALDEKMYITMSDDILNDLKTMANDTILYHQARIYHIEDGEQSNIESVYNVDGHYDRDEDGISTIGVRYEDSYLKKALSLELEPFSEDIYDTVYADSSMARAYSLSVDDVFDRIIIFMYAYKDGTIITIRSNRDRFEEIAFYVNDRVF